MLALFPSYPGRSFQLCSQPCSQQLLEPLASYKRAGLSSQFLHCSLFAAKGKLAATGWGTLVCRELTMWLTMNHSVLTSGHSLVQIRAFELILMKLASLSGCVDACKSLGYTRANATHLLTQQTPQNLQF
jgi:hypothetical protein